jgi:SAM-dependent methyltransferase
MNDVKQFWETRYVNGQTGWDLKEVSPPLKHLINDLPRKDLQILIPGCGNAYEAAYLMQQGFTDVTVLDIAEMPLKALQNQMQRDVTEGRLKLICEDFFLHKGQYDVILEQTFFCAIDPKLRERYAQKMHELLKPGGVLTGVLFNREFEGGPPFGGNVKEYENYFEPLFSSVSFPVCDKSAAPRAGSEVWMRVVK